MDGSLPRAYRSVIALAVCALATGGCAGRNLPRIDPTGQQLFTTAPPTALPPGVPNMRPSQLPPPSAGPRFALPQIGTPAPAPIVSHPPVQGPPFAAPTVGAPVASAVPPVVSPPTIPPPLPPAAPVGVVPVPPSVAVVPGVGPRRSLVGGHHTGAPGADLGKHHALFSGKRPSGAKAIAISPPELFAPVGSQVVLRAGVCGHDGKLVAGTPVEWMLSPDSTGQFVQVGELGESRFLHLSKNSVGKINNNYAVGTTSSAERQLPPTTLAPSLSGVTLLAGESWISIASPTEGTSHVMALSPSIEDSQLRTSFAKVHWIDARWTFPPPAVNPAGAPHTFTTTVARNTDGAPIGGWQVRYEIVGGTPAGFAPDGAQVLEVPTNELGQASVEVVQHGPVEPGTTRIGIQVIRPALSNARDDRRLILGVGATTKTWTAPDVAIRATGPTQGELGATLAYRIEVSNPGTLALKGATVLLQIPAGLSYVSSDVPTTGAADSPSWNLGELPAGARRTLLVRLRVDRQGTFNVCANVRTREGLAAQDCVSTSAARARIEVDLKGPVTAEVGSTVRYGAVVRNVSPTPARNLVITDTFDDGLEHLVDKSPIEKVLGDVAAGQSQSVFISFRVTKPGQLCHTVVVSGEGGLSARAEACLTARQPQVEPQPAPQPAPQPGKKAGIELRKTGPARLRVGETAKFAIEIINTGDIPLINLRIEDRYDRELQPTDATEGYAVDDEGLPVDAQGRPADLLFWRLARLEPGETHKLQVHCECMAAKPSVCNRVTVECDQRPVIADDACLEILPKEDGPPPRQPPVEPEPAVEEPREEPATEEATETPVPAPADVRHTIASFQNPTRVGEQVKYQIDVVNHGQASDKSVALVVKFPDHMRPVAVGTVAPVRYKVEGDQIVFEPVAELRAGEPVQFVIPFEMVRAGNARIEAVLRSDARQQAITKSASVDILAQ